MIQGVPEIRIPREENRARMADGRLYLPSEPDIMEEQTLCLDRLYEFNHTRPTETDKRTALAKEMFAAFGEGSYIEPPFYSNWGGKHVHLGKDVYFNFACTLVDDTDIYIDDKCMFGPQVTIATAGHPILPGLREQAMQYNLPVHIGRNVWVGAGAVILPGVTIGENCVIGAGSVVNKDIPANSIAVGNPCRVLREIGARDRETYWRDRKIDFNLDVE